MPGADRAGVPVAAAVLHPRRDDRRDQGLTGTGDFVASSAAALASGLGFGYTTKRRHPGRQGERIETTVDEGDAGARERLRPVFDRHAREGESRVRAALRPNRHAPISTRCRNRASQERRHVRGCDDAGYASAGRDRYTVSTLRW